MEISQKVSATLVTGSQVLDKFITALGTSGEFLSGISDSEAFLTFVINTGNFRFSPKACSILLSVVAENAELNLALSS
jgi:hypothetical protein